MKQEESFNYVKERFLDVFDENDDDRIDISEMAQILPTEENFLLLFRFKNPLTSSVEFMRVWREFDKDCSGFIEADELKVRFTVIIFIVFRFFIFYKVLKQCITKKRKKNKNNKQISELKVQNVLIYFFQQDFLEDLLKEANREDQVTEEQLLEYTTTMVRNLFTILFFF